MRAYIFVLTIIRRCRYLASIQDDAEEVDAEYDGDGVLGQWSYGRLR